MSRAWGSLLKSGTALAVVLLALSCGGGSSPTETGPKTVTITVKDFAYEPRSVTINPGDTVRWTLQGSDLTHTVTSIKGVFDSGKVFTSSGATFERTFSEANQTFEYSCKTHKDCCDMKGSIRVGEAAPPPDPGYQ